MAEKKEPAITQAQYEALLKEIENLKNAKTPAQEAEEKQAQAIKEQEEYDRRASELLKEKVKIKLFKDNGKYKDDVTVGHNGRIYKIQRGIPVTIPKEVAMILDQADLQSQIAASYSDEKEAEYENSKRAFI